MRKLQLLFFFFSACVIRAQTPTMDWITEITGPDDQWIGSMLYDETGNLYVSGFSRNHVTYFRNHTLDTKSDGFLARYDSAGNILWTKELPGPAMDMTFDHQGNLVLCGSFANLGYFGSKKMVSTSKPDYEDLFLAKTNFNGELIWIVQSEGKGHETGLCVDVTSDGSILLLAKYGLRSDAYSGNYVPGNLSGTVLPEPPYAQYNSLLALYTAAGKNVWVKTFEGECNHMVVNSKDEIYIETYCASGLLADPEDSLANMYYGNLLKIDLRLHLLQVIMLPQINIAEFNVDRDDNLLVIGTISRVLAYDEWRADKAMDGTMVVRKISPYGNLLWEYCDIKNTSKSIYFGGLEIAGGEHGEVFVAHITKPLAAKHDTATGYVTRVTNDGVIAETRAFIRGPKMVFQHVCIGQPNQLLVSAVFHEGYYLDNKLVTNYGEGNDAWIARFSFGRPVATTTNEKYAENIYFGKDSCALTHEMKLRAMGAARFAKDHPDAKITCAGHTDKDPKSGKAQPNDAKCRANSVRDFLIANGVDSARITVESKGALQPKAPNATEGTRALNRRVEIMIQ